MMILDFTKHHIFHNLSLAESPDLACLRVMVSSCKTVELDIKLVTAAASHIEIFLENAGLYEDLNAMFLGTLESLTASIQLLCRHRTPGRHLPTRSVSGGQPAPAAAGWRILRPRWCTCPVPDSTAFVRPDGAEIRRDYGDWAAITLARGVLAKQAY